MNQTIDELFSRKSTRVFSDEPITSQEKSLILQAAIQAPTAGNMSLFSIIDVQSQEIKDILAKHCDNQPFIAKAPVVLVFLADYQKWQDMFEYYGVDVPAPAEADLLLAMEDCIIAAQNAVVAAESLGIGSCYIGDILENFEANQKLLNLPKYAVPVAMVVFGKPTEQQKKRQKPERFDVRDLVFTDTYKIRNSQETVDMFERKLKKREDELREYIIRFAGRKIQAQFHQEMSRSSKAIIDSWVK